MSHTESRSVTLQVAGPGIDPTALSREFGVIASYSRPPSSPDSGIWVLDTRDQVLGDRLGAHLDWLATRLSGHRERLAELGNAGLARLLVNGHPAQWQLAAGDMELARQHLGVTPEFVTFVPSSRQIRVDEVRYQE